MINTKFFIHLLFHCTVFVASAQSTINLVVPRMHSGYLVNWDISPTGEYGLSAGSDNTLILWETSTGNFIKELANDSTMRGAHFLSDAQHIAIRGASQLVIKSIYDGKILQQLNGTFKSMLVCEKRNEFVLHDLNDQLILYRLKKGLYEKVKSIRLNSTITALCYSENGNTIMYYDNKVRIYDPLKNKASEFNSALLTMHGVKSMALNADKSKLAVGTADGIIYIFNPKQQKPIDSLVSYTTSTYWAAYSDKIFRDSVRLDLPVLRLAFDGANRIESLYVGAEWDSYRGTKFHYIRWELSDRNKSVHRNDLFPCVQDNYGFSKGRLFCNYEIFDLVHNTTALLKGSRTQVQDAAFADGGKKILFSVREWDPELKKSVEQKWVWDIIEGTQYSIDATLTKPHFNSFSNFIGAYGDILSNMQDSISDFNGYKKVNVHGIGLFDLHKKKISRYTKNVGLPFEDGRLIFHPIKSQMIVSKSNASIVYDIEQDKIIKKLKDGSVMGFSKNGNFLKGGKYIYSTVNYEIIDSINYTFIPKKDASYDSNESIEWIKKEQKNPGYWFILYDGVFLTKTNKYIFQGYGKSYVRDYKAKSSIDSLQFGLGECREVTPDENLLAIGYRDGSIDLYNTDNLKLIKELKVHDAMVMSIDFTPDSRYMMSLGDDRTVRFWDLTKYEEVAKVIFYGNEWVVVTPDHLFDGSTGGLEKLFFIDGLKTIDLKQVKDRFFEPGLLQKVLSYSKEPLRKSQGLNSIKSYPKIDVEDPAKNEKGLLVINLTNEGGGIGKVKILINGKEASSDARGDGFNPDADKTTITFKLSNHPYLKQNELNQIEILASNKDGYLISKPKKFHYLVKGTHQEDIRLHAIIVGSSNYNGTELDLRFASNDAEQFAHALEESGKKLFGVNSVNIQLLTTDRQDHWPSKERIMQAFKTISTTATPYDLLVVYLAGHGTNFGGAEGDFYYLTADAKNGNLTDPVIRQSVAISSEEFTEYIKWVPSLKQIMILDACHSGKFAEDLLAKREAKSSSEIRALERMKDRTGLYILAGSASDAVSYEASVYGQGLLTYSLLFGMKGAALRDNQFVDVMELFQYCADEVPRLASNIGGIQKPELRVPFGGESFDIGIVDNNIKESIKLPTPKPVFLRAVFQDEETFADPLGLSEYLDQQLKNLGADKAETEVIFIDAMKFTDGYSLRGRYKKVGAIYHVNCKLLKGDKLFKDLSITGETLEGIGKKIIEQSIKSIPH